MTLTEDLCLTPPSLISRTLCSSGCDHVAVLAYTAKFSSLVVELLEIRGTANIWVLKALSFMGEKG